MIKTGIGGFSKRCLAFVLALLIVTTCVPLEASAEDDGEPYAIMLNGSDASAAKDVKVAYGESIALTIPGYTGTGTPAFVWLSGTTAINGSESWSSWEAGAPTEPGKYYIGYQFENAEGDTISLLDGSCSFTITKAVLARPTGAHWQGGSTACWSSVTKTLGGANAAVSGYKVTMYKDGEVTGKYDVTGAGTTSLDLAGVMTGNGKGLYTFTVQAVSADETHYTTSDASAKSAVTAVVLVSVAAGEGVASVTPASPQLLIAGNSARNSVAVTAALKSGRTFSGWSAGAADAVTFGEQSALETIATLKDGCTVTELTLTAATSDTTAPTISAYTAGTGDDYGKLTGTASDEGGHVAQYAFSTASTVDGVTAGEWQTVGDNTAGAYATVEMQVTTAGKYYFYVKDSAGNSARSESYIQASEVDYSGFYQNGTADATHKDFVVGAEALTLSVPSRPGFSSNGWHIRTDCSDTAITSVSGHSDSPVTVYTQWTRSKIDITAQHQGYSGEYDGTEHAVSVTVGSMAGEVSYQWYKDGKAIEGAADSSYNVKNVADSGVYKVVVTNTLDGSAQSVTSADTTVSITKKELTVTAEDKTLGYGETAPGNFYTYKLTGLVAGEDGSVLTAGSLSCAYDPAASGAGMYAITASGFSAANYDIAYADGTLTVARKNGATGAGMNALLAAGPWTYTGSAIEPALTVTDGEKTLTEGTDYTLTYSDNVNVGAGTASVAFIGNYTGEKQLGFEIVKASFTPSVILSGWTYGETGGVPALDTNNSGGAAEYYYYAKSGSADAAVTAQPKAAGVYYVYAVIAGTANYNSVMTAATEFTIAKRVVTITAASGSWEYDGSSHSAPNYIKEGSFAKNEGFQSVSANGSITNVGTTANVVSYKLTTVTDPANYDIVAVNGTLTITKRALTAPSNCSWDVKNPGTADWVAVTRSGLSVSYEYELFRVTDNGVKTSIMSGNTPETSVNLADAIRRDSADNGAAGYCFKVMALPAGGVSRDNYSAGEYSDNSSVIYTARVTVTGGEGVETATINGAAEAILIQNETAQLAAAAQEGYSFNGDIWSEASGNIVIGDAKAAATTATLFIKTGTAADIGIAASCRDDIPVITAFSAATYGGDSMVRFTFSATDTKTITGWAVTKSGTEEPAESDWNSVSVPALDGQTLEGVTDTGSYYLWVRDNGGNTVCSSANDSGATGIEIYSIAFAGGEGGSGSMSSMLKVENIALTLPVCAFTRTGYSFRNWRGESGLYTNGGAYEANKSDTLVVQWTDEQFAYTVNYYLMDTAGSYPEQPSQTSRFSGAYGTVIASGSSIVALSLKGMEQDTAEGRTSTITLTENGLTLAVYYKRLQYVATYSYTTPTGSTVTTSDTYYYGAAFTEKEKPAVDGYAFVGWIYDGSGKAPATMPNNNLTGRGTFVPANAHYLIHCYEQNITADGTGDTNYTLMEALDRSIGALHGDTVNFSLSDALRIDGFTAAYVTVSSGAVGGSIPSGTATTASGTVSNQESSILNINFYYTRNTYKLTLNVYDSNLRENAIYKYTEDRLYGAVIDAEAFANHDKANWTGAPEGSVLASYADWSTGAAPSVMPAGDVSVARDYVKAVEVSYGVEVYCENADGTYSLQSTLTYYGFVGTNVTIGDSDDDSVNYTKFTGSVADFIYYDFDAGNEGNVTSATVSKDGDTRLKVYFQRKTFKTTITYYYNDGTQTTNVKLATVVKTGKWGTEYTCQPLALFDGSVPAAWDDNGVYTAAGSSISPPYDFKANSYTADYVAYYWDEYNHWQSCKYTTVASLTDHAGDKYIFGKSDNGYVAVYYIKANREIHYTLDVMYNPRNLAKSGDNSNHPLTVTVNGTTYNVRVANKADIFTSTWTSSDGDYTAYPALGTLSGSYTYGELKSGFSEVTVNGATYYLNAAEPGYIYMADAESQFYFGNRVGYNFLSDELNTGRAGYDTVENYLANYKATHGDSADAVNYDDKRNGAYIYNGGYSSIMYGNGTYVFTFDYAATYSVSYTMNGNTHTDTGYVYAQTVNVGCDDTGAFPAKPGYTVRWYTDTNYTTLAADFSIRANTVFYGRYVRSTVEYTVTNYYQLPDTGEFITDTAAAGLIRHTDSETVTFTDGAGVEGNYNVTVTKYYLGDSLVIAIRKLPCLAYSAVLLDYNKYLIDGLIYDDANSKNMTKGYCEAAGISLVSYYKRVESALTVNAKTTDVETVTISICRAGQSITLNAPEKAGYTFAGWSIQCEEDGAQTEWTGTRTTGTDKSVTFAMPVCALYATAQWTPAPYASTLVHYFETTGHTYDADLYERLAGMTGADATIDVGGVSYAGKVYGEGGTVAGVSAVIDGRTYFFSAAMNDGGVYRTDAADLIAVSEQMTALSESVLTVADKELALTGYPYMFSFTEYRRNTDSGLLAGTDTYTYAPDVSIEYYYTRASGYSVTVAAAASDGGDAGLMLTGGGADFSYGETATVRAAVAAGYTFVGWYLASDTEHEAPVSTSAEYSFRVRDNVSLVAFSQPAATAEPTVDISGQTGYIYGYNSARTNAITAAVTFAEGTDSANKVVSYQWYAVNGESAAKIDGAVSSTYIFPAGKPCGNYSYRCDVVVTRSDTGRSATVKSNVLSITVMPAGIAADVAGYDGIYDGAGHGITVTAGKPVQGNTVYYSATELTAANYLTAGSTTNPLYTNVRMIDGAVGSYTVYYYIHNADANYSDVSGSAQVKITPIRVSLKESGSYHRVYDGTAAVSGSVTEAGTGKYDLSHGTSITIVGLLSGDAELYIADFDAAFNSKDVKSAGSVTLSNVRIVSNATGEVNCNYKFAGGYTIVISGYITPFILSTGWGSDTSFVYDGTEKKPSIALTSLTGVPEPAIAEGLVVQGAQINVGTYTAYAAITPGESYELSNYSFSNASCDYEITKRAITIAPVVPDAGSVVYNGAEQNVTGFTIGGAGLAIVNGEAQTYSAEADRGATNAGTTVITAKNMHIYQGDADVSDNYAVTYRSSDFVIGKKTVTVSGFLADNKVYDGTAAASVRTGGLIFTGCEAGDSLSIPAGNVTAAFGSAGVGTDKTVTVTLEPDDLAGTSAANYALDVVNSTLTCTADIAPAVITVTGDAKETVYGKDVTFTAAYTGFVNGETENVISGTVGYTVKSGASAAAPYTVTTAAGTYDIVPDVSGLSADNYIFAAADGQAKLTVAKRPLAVKASEDPDVTKKYDGTAKAAVDGGDWVFAAVIGNTDSGIVNEDVVTLTFSAAYDSKDVSDNRTVTMSGLAIDNANYIIYENSCIITAGCAITRTPLTITAANKTVTYGNAAPAFTAEYSGFVGGESASVLGGTLTYDCGYDAGDADKRGAGSYTITPSGSTAGNYEITFRSGTLTVSKAVITATANAASLIYGIESSVPVYTSVYSGFKYADDASVITGTLTTTCSKTYSDTPGEYAGAITPVTAGLSADNYTFRAAAAKLTIVKHEIKITGITVNGKTYDGTTAVSAAQINTAGAVYEGILDEDINGRGVTVTGVYDSKNVGTGIRVGLTIGLNSYLAARYTLAKDTQSETTAVITQKTLTVKVDNKSIKYADAEPVYTVSYNGFVSGEGKSVLTGTLAFTESYTADAASMTYSTAGTYTVSASGYDQSGNYAISYTDGTLTVAQAKLSAPTVSWTGTTPGTVEWTAVTGIGAVAVGGYSIRLCKEGETDAVKTVTVGADIRSCNFLEDMRGHGAGEYKVQVVAIASDENNTGKANVADSAAGTSGSQYAAKVNVAFAPDAISQAAAAAMTGDDKAISINAATTSSYVMIAGEAGSAITAFLKNATGFGVKSLTSGSTALTLASPATDGVTVSSAASMSASLASAADINVTLTIAGDPATAVFGYTAETAPKLTATVGPASGDNLEKTGYTYTYKWYLKEGAGANNAMEGGGSAAVSFPTGKSAASDKYHVTCEVTATRNDNGQSKTVTSTSQLVAKTYFNVVIARAPFTSVVSLEGWTYGETRKTPSVSNNPGQGTVTYEYNTAADAQSNWTTTIPKDAGTYYVRAFIPQTLNYNQFQTQAVAFTIAKAKLATPDGLTMSESATTPYGLMSWNAVPGPRENAGASADSTIAVKYEVKLYRAATDSETDGDWELVYTSDAVTATSLDLTSRFTQAGFYRFTVKALAACSNGNANCDDSDESARGGVIEIKSTMGTEDTTYEYNKVYDGEPIRLDAVNDLEGVTYQWLCNKTEIAGATGRTLDVTFVGETGTYTCKLTIGDESYYSSNHIVTITPRQVNVTSDTQTKVYDGTPLAGVTKLVTTLGTGDTITYTLATRTDTGTSKNAITGVTITHNGTMTVFSEGGTYNNYTLTKTEGTLAVTARSLANGTDYNTGITVSKPDVVIYDGTAHTPTVTVTDSTIQVNGADKVLVLNTDYTVAYSANKDAGTAVITITGKGNYSGTITRSFTISRRSVILTSASQTREYNGAALTNGTVTVTGDRWAAGEGAVYTVTGSQLDVGESLNTFTYTLNSGTKAVNYIVQNIPGRLAVTKNTSPVTVVAGSGSKIYDGTALTKNSFTHTGTIASIDVLSAAVAGTRTKAGESANVVTSYKVTRASDNRDVTEYYTFAASVNGKLTVEKRKVTLTSASQTREYNGAALTNGTVTVTGDGWAAGEGATYSVTGSRLDAGESPNSFTYMLNSGIDPINYTITQEYGRLRVNAVSAKIAVTANSKTKTYDGTALTDGGATYTGNVLISGDVLTAVVAGTQTNAGESANVVTSYKVTRTSDSKDVTQNYTFAASVPGKLTVEKRKVTLTSGNLEKTYDGAALTDTGANPVTVSGDGWAAGEGATYSVTGSRLDAGESPNSFTYMLNSGTDPNNYTVTQEYGRLRVNAVSAKIVVTANSKTKTYDGTALTDGGATYTGNVLISGDVLTAVVAGTQTNAGESANVVTSYKVTRTSDSKDVTQNYTFAASVPGKLTVEKKAVSITVDSAHKIYNTADPAFTGTVTGLVAAGDLGTISYIRTNATINSAGAYPGVLTANFTENGNYAVTVTKGDFTIEKSGALTVSSAGYDAVYDGGSHAPTASANVGAGTQISYSTDGGVTWSGTIPSIKDVGTVTVKAKAENADYVTAQCSYTLKVGKKPVTIAVNSASKTFGTADPAFTGTVTGLVAAGDLGTISYIRTNTTFNSAGAYPGVLTANFTENGNYAVTVTRGSFTIAARSLANGTAYNTGITVSEPDAVMYDGTAHTPSVTVSDAAIQSGGSGKVLVSGTDYTVAYSANRDAGTALVTITGAGNYSGTITRNFTIDRRKVTLTSASQTREYNGAALTNFTVTVTGDGWVAGEGAAYSVTGSQLDAGESLNTFTCMLNNGTDPNNYTITQEYGRLKVNPIATLISVTANSNIKTYDGTALTDGGFTYTGNVLVSGDVLSAVVTGMQTDAGESANNVVSYKVTRTSDSKDVTQNYTFADSIPGKLTVEKAAGAVTITSQPGKEYDGLPEAVPTVTKTGDGELSFVYYKVESGTETVLSGAPKDTGAYKVKATLAMSNNFTAAQSEPVSFMISPKRITVTANDAQSAFGENVAALSADVTSEGKVCDGDDLHIGASTAVTPATPVGSYTITPVYDDNANYEVTPVNGTYTVVAAAMPCNAAGTSTVYDGATHGITITGPETMTVYYSTTELTEANYATASTEPLTYTNAGVYKVWYYVTAANYIPAAGSLNVEIARREITLTAGSKTQQQNGSALTCSEYALTSGSLAVGDSIRNVTTEGSISTVGSKENIITGEVIENTAGNDVTANYAVTTVNGILTVTAQPTTQAGPGKGVTETNGGGRGGNSGGVETPAESVNPTATEKPGASVVPTPVPTAGVVKDEPVADAKTYDIGAGEIKVTVNCYDGRGERLKGEVASSQNVVDACATQEELAAVNGGEKLEIKLDATIDAAKTDAAIAAGETSVTVMPEGSGTYEELALGAFVELDLEKRLGETEWTRLHTLDKGITVTIAIPEKLLAKGSAFYIAIPSENGYILLADEDNDPQSITFTSKVFSSCAIVYEPETAAAGRFVIFNLVAAMLSVVLAVIDAVRKKRDRVAAVATAATAVVAYVFLFSTGVPVMFNIWSILFAALLAATVLFSLRKGQECGQTEEE